MTRARWTGILCALLLGGITAGAVLAQETTDGDPEAGARLYSENCAVCHGLEGKGRVGANLSDAFAGIDVTAFVEQTVALGVDGSPMPAWSQANGGPLSEQEVADVAAYVIRLAGGTEPVAPAPTIPPAQPVTPRPDLPGDPAEGHVLFLQNCAMCHGDRGQGRIGASLAKAWPGIDPAAYVRTTVEQGVPGSPMPAWSQANGGPLTDEEISHISAYVLSLGGPSVNRGPEVETAPGPLSMTVSLILAAVLVALLVIVGVIYYRRSPRGAASEER